jgi:hypothetical protein
MTPAGVAESEPDMLRAFVTGQVADRLIESGGELTEERRLVAQRRNLRPKHRPRSFAHG